MATIRNMEWITEGSNNSNGFLRLLDQTRLPNEVTYLDCRTVENVWQAIKRLSVRGAPAIGIAAAYACVIAVDSTAQSVQSNEHALDQAAAYLATSRPTAVNLFWALERMKRVQPCTPGRLLAEALAIHEEDREMCRRIGEHGLELLLGLKSSLSTLDSPPSTSLNILTHCNAGALATGGIGTATAPMYLAKEGGLALKVFADETRPLLQGSRLTAFELANAGIDVTVICDDMAGQVMREGRVACVITGADRIAANGDAANKIGTYSLAVLARHHGLPFYVAAPRSTFDLSISNGSHIPIEQRAPEEVRPTSGNVRIYNPAFDVTPHELITAIITDAGVIQPVDEANVWALVGG